MPWILNSSEGHQSYPAPAGETFYIVASLDNAGLTATRDAPNDASGILGTLAVYSFGGKLEAGSEDLIVSPPFARPSKNAQTRNDDPPIEGFVLQAKTETHVQTIILRHQDRIFSGAKSGGLTFEWKPPQIQVQSSEKKIEAAEGEEEIEDDGDDDDLDNTVVPGGNKTQTMRSTPHLSLSHSDIIQETPTIDRISEIGNLPSRTGRREMRREPPVATPIVYSASRGRSIPNDLALPEESADTDKSGASDKSSPEPHIPEVGTAKSTKRSSQAKEDQGTPSARSSKRIKVSGTDTATASALSARKSATKKRQPATKPDSTPSRSQHSTPASPANSLLGSPIDVQGDYDGPKPRVALSNSSIQPTTGFSRFLKRHGGSIVDSVEADCNILSIRPGPLTKTAKLLHSIALGLPIVTDTWLLHSTSASRLLPLTPYIPPELSPVWRTPQSHLFRGYTVYFSPALKASYTKAAFADVEKLCKEVGVRRVISKKAGGIKDFDEKTVCLVEGRGDPDLGVLRGMGRVCYGKEFLTGSVVRGEVDLGGGEYVVREEEEEGEEEGEGEGEVVDEEMEEEVEEKPAKRRGRTRNG